jgi:hypothetical protein
MFMFLPYVSWVDGFLLPMIISLIGLAGFWSYIFLRQAPKMQKWARFGALTFIGMLSTHAFTIGIGAQRTMATRPGYPFYKDFTWWLFNWVGEVNWVVVILLFMSIPLLAVGWRKGWWLAIIGAITILMIDLPTQFFRTKTLDYLYGSLLSLGVLVFNKIAPLRLKVNGRRCVDCGRCDVECPMDITDAHANSRDLECIQCLECLETCAVKETVTLELL